MDNMQDWEITLLADSLNSSLRDEWEMTRWIVYSVLQPYLKKSLREKPVKDLFPMPFDEEDEEEHNITNEQIRQLKERSKIIATKLNKK